MTLHAHPMVSALIAAGAFATVAFGLEGATRPELEVSRITPGEAPKIDGDLSDPAWTRATPVSVVTTQGGDFGGSGQSTIEARALHDGEFAYFAFVWTDPTRSLKHLPLVKTRDGWSLAATDRSGANENRFHEDKFAVLISQPTLPLIGAAIHLSPAPLSDMPPSATHRGLHYTPDGSVADMWVWRASHEGADRHVDNCHFGGAATPTEEQRAGLTRYAGGFAPDPLPQAYYSNVVLRQAPTLAGRAETVPRRLPRDLNQTLRSLGRISDSAHQSEAEGARWWLAEDQSVAYSEERDAKIPLGTVIPGIVISSTAAPDPSALKGRARWASGRWTLEVVRRLRSPSRHDVPIADGSMLWLAAFDHSQTRHTRHLRPFTLEVDQ